MPTDIHPFPGLRPFKTDEQYLFFGREGQSAEIVSRLRKKRFLALIGSSGSGKSSLIGAGLLPYLEGGFMAGAGSGWRVAIFRPGNDPIGRLARTLNDPAVLGSSQAANEDMARDAMLLEVTLRRSGLGLIEAVKLARLPERENLLVIVDQFEELFRFERAAIAARHQDDAAAFVKLLLEATAQAQVPIYVVVAMRSDFIGECARFRNLPEAVTSSPYVIPWMTREQQRAAIADPVLVAGAAISPRLVNRLLNDAGENPDQLPILQHALMRTWDNWRTRAQYSEPLDVEQYLAIGGIEDALSRHANEAYGELPDDRSQLIGKRMFQALTEKGTDKRGVRRPAAVAQIAAIANAGPAEVLAVAEHFRRPGRGFLVAQDRLARDPDTDPADDDTVLDISHESLINGWNLLRKWVDEEAESARIYKRLADRAAEHEKGNSALLRDPDLQKALEWRDCEQPNATWAERYDPGFHQAIQFLEKSQAADLLIKETEVQEQQAELQRKTSELRRARKQFWVLAVVCGVALIFAGLAYYALKAAKREAANAKSSETRASEDEERALGFAVRTLNSLSKLLEKPANDALEVPSAGTPSFNSHQASTEEAYRKIYNSAFILSGDILKEDPSNRKAKRLFAASLSYSDHLLLSAAIGKSDQGASLYEICNQHVDDAWKFSPKTDPGSRVQGVVLYNSPHDLVPGILLFASSADILLELKKEEESKQTAGFALEGITRVLQTVAPEEFDDTEWQILATSATAVRGVLEGKSRWENTFVETNDESTGRRRNSSDRPALGITNLANTSVRTDRNNQAPYAQSGLRFSNEDVPSHLIGAMTEIAYLERDEPDTAVKVLNSANALATEMKAHTNDAHARDSLFLSNLRLGEVYASLAQQRKSKKNPATAQQALLNQSQQAYERADEASTPQSFGKITILQAIGNLDRQRAEMEENMEMRSKDLQNAIDHHQSGISLIPSKNDFGDLSIMEVDLRCELGHDLLLTGQLGRGEKEFQRAATLFPIAFAFSPTDSPDARQQSEESTLGVYNYIVGAYEDAYKFRAGPSEDDERTYFVYGRGWVDKALALFNARRENAKSDAERRFVNTKIARLYGGRSWVDLLQGDFNQAVIDAKRGFSLDRTQIWILTNEAHGYLFQGQIENARNIYRNNLDKPTHLEENQTFREAVMVDFQDFRENKYPNMNLAYISSVEADVNEKRQ